MRARRLAVFVTVPWLALGCAIADEDRCRDGLVRDEAIQVCRALDSETNDDTGTDLDSAGAADTVDGRESNGMTGDAGPDASDRELDSANAQDTDALDTGAPDTGKNVTFFTGTYGYTGEYTDIKKRSVARVDMNLNPDWSVDDTFVTDRITTEAYREYAVSYDVSVSVFDFRLQSVNHPLRDVGKGRCDGGDRVSQGAHFLRRTECQALSLRHT